MSEYKNFVYSYRHEDKEWSFHVYARDFDDAFARMRAIRRTGQLDGELVCEIPCNETQSIFLKAICEIRNFFHWVFAG